jgi:hypothetical protein
MDIDSVTTDRPSGDRVSSAIGTPVIAGAIVIFESSILNQIAKGTHQHLSLKHE